MKIRQNINLLIECEKRFSQKPWYSESWLNSLMGRLAYLDDDEVNLILDLTERFQYLRLTELNSKLLAAFNKIPVNRLNTATRILFAPLKSPYIKEEKRWKKRLRTEGWKERNMSPPSKSADMIFRIMQIEYPHRYQPYVNKIFLCNKPQDIANHYVKDALIVLWDDFVGSGDSAFTAIADIQKLICDEGKNIDENNYAVVCVCAMQEGIDILDYFKLKCYACDVYQKAISDDASLTQQQRNVRIASMQSAEKKVVKGAVKNYSLGYHQSETLLSIIDKCPNNTFPFYWFASQHNVSPVFYRRK